MKRKQGSQEAAKEIPLHSTAENQSSTSPSASVVKVVKGIIDYLVIATCC